MTEDVRALSVRDMRALAHPLRVRLLGLLRAEGPATATELASRVGHVTSGTTSWHLRRLAEVGLVEEAEGRTGRERRWAAAHRHSRIDNPDPAADPETADAVEALAREFAEVHARNVQHWLDTWREADVAWVQAAGLSDHLLRLTPARLAALNAELDAVVRRYRDEAAAAAAAHPEAGAEGAEVTAGAGDPEDPATLPVTVQVQSFPRFDLDPSAGDVR